MIRVFNRVKRVRQSFILSILVLSAAAQAAPARALQQTSAPAAKPSATVRRWMRGMTLRDEVAQLLCVESRDSVPHR